MSCSPNTHTHTHVIVCDCHGWETQRICSPLVQKTATREHCVYFNARVSMCECACVIGGVEGGGLVNHRAHSLCRNAEATLLIRAPRVLDRLFPRRRRRTTPSSGRKTDTLLMYIMCCCVLNSTHTRITVAARLMRVFAVSCACGSIWGRLSVNRFFMSDFGNYSVRNVCPQTG